MALKLKVTEDFEQLYGGEVRKFIKGQELVGDGEFGGMAAFMGMKHPDKVELVEGVWIPPKFDVKKKLEEEKSKEAQIAESVEELKEEREEKRKEAVKAERDAHKRSKKKKK